MLFYQEVGPLGHSFVALFVSAVSLLGHFPGAWSHPFSMCIDVDMGEVVALVFPAPFKLLSHVVVEEVEPAPEGTASVFIVEPLDSDVIAIDGNGDWGT